MTKDLIDQILKDIGLEKIDIEPENDPSDGLHKNPYESAVP